MDPFVGEVSLPGVTLRYAFPLPGRELLIVAGGRAPSPDWLRDAARGREVWCADRGADACLAAGVTPSRIVGDADSADADAWAWAERSGASVERFPSAKDFTDTQLALRRAAKMPSPPFVILSGALGGRLDHAVSNVRSFVASRLSGCLADGRELLFVLGGGESAVCETSRPPKAISLVPLTRACKGVTVSGTRWALSDARLLRDEANAVSNELAVGERGFFVKNGGGLLAVYVCDDERGL